LCEPKLRYPWLLASLTPALALLLVQAQRSHGRRVGAPVGRLISAPASTRPARAASTTGDGRSLPDAHAGPGHAAAVGYTIAKTETLAGRCTRFQALNRRGVIAGLTTQPNGRVLCFLYSDGRVCDLAARGCRPSVVLDVNNHAQVVGQAMTRQGYQAFLYVEGEIRSLGTLGVAPSQACGINDLGQVVGWSSTRESGIHAFLYRDGAMRDLGTLGGEDSEAFGINSTGQVVGRSRTGREANHAFLWSQGRMADLGTLGGDLSEARHINDAGQIVGCSSTSSGDTHACLWNGDALTDLGTLGGQQSWAYDINDAGVIVGESTIGGIGRGTHAYLYRDGVMQDLNRLIPASSGWVLATAQSINDAGQIAGNGVFHGKSRGFLLTPTRSNEGGAMRQ
jgi:probable HAF family extracellular repeat protein